MVEKFGVLVRRRGRAGIERLAGLYRTSGMKQNEFCRVHGLGLSTPTRYLRKQSREPRQSGLSETGPSRRVSVELGGNVATDCNCEATPQFDRQHTHQAHRRPHARSLGLRSLKQKLPLTAISKGLLLARGGSAASALAPEEPQC